MSKHAVILAGGKGTRLRPYTVVFPKPLMPISEFPILEIVIKQLVYFGYTSITLAVNHQADMIKTFCGDGSRWGVDISYSMESKPLNTMGPLKLIPDLPESFLVMNGDVLTDLNFGDFYINHEQNDNIFTISSYRRDVNIDYGILELDQSNVLTGFIEKPTKTFFVSMGVYMLNKKVLDYIPENIPYGFDDLMLDLISDNKKVKVNKFKGYWMDIGRPEDYMKAIDDFDQNRDRFIYD